MCLWVKRKIYRAVDAAGRVPKNIGDMLKIWTETDKKKKRYLARFATRDWQSDGK